MPRKLVLIMCAGTFGIAGGAMADPFLPVPPASFINYHVDTVHQLSQQIAVDAVVRGRLAHYFHMSGPAVTTYVQKNLMLSYLKTAGTYKVACVTPSGHEYFVTQHLPKGTAVFALTSTGKPILKRACGNPLVSSLPAIVPSHLSQTATRTGQPALADSPATATEPADIIASSVVPGDTTLTEVPGLTGGDVGSLGPFTRVGAFPVSSIGGGGGGFGLPLAGLAALGVLGLASSHNGGGNNNSSPTPTPTPTPIPTPIPTPVPAPEPSTLAVYGIGALGLAGLAYARRRTQRNR